MKGLLLLLALGIMLMAYWVHSVRPGKAYSGKVDSTDVPVVKKMKELNAVSEQRAEGVDGQ